MSGGRGRGAGRPDRLDQRSLTKLIGDLAAGRYDLISQLVGDDFDTVAPWVEIGENEQPRPCTEPNRTPLALGTRVTRS